MNRKKGVLRQYSCTAKNEPTQRVARRPKKKQKKDLAATYSPAKMQYHRRESA